MRALTTAVAVMFLSGCCYYTPRARQTVGTVPLRGQPPPTVEPLVRVRLATGSFVSVGSSQGLTLAAGPSCQSVGPNLSVQVKCEGGYVLATVGTSHLRTADTLAVAPVGSGFVRVGDRSYRGRLLLFKSSDGALAVVNVLGIEDYLLGVVPCEIGPINARTLEAAKAQAVAARSFTITRLGRRKGVGFDISDSYQRDQEYHGIESETELSSEAVLATRGEVIEFHGEICEALYHGNCGGVTANGSQPYLRSVLDTPGHCRGRKAYCAGMPNFTWQAEFKRESLDAVVSRLSSKACQVRRGSLETDRQSGRVEYVDLATDRGEVRLSGSDFRMALGLKSTSFRMAIHGATVHFDGRGSGHGSGMCQDGAVAMAESGASYREILEHYYSGVTLRKQY